MDKRHARSVGTFGLDGLAILKSSHVGVVGCGGLGGYVIEILARCGVGCISVVDRDVFEESNLNRQLLATSSTIGKPKAFCAKQRIIDIDPSIEVLAHAVELSDQNAAELLGRCNVIVDALDSPEARLLLSRKCSELEIPLVFGAVAGWYGQVSAVWPGDALYEELYANPNSHGEASLGNIAPTCACVASYQTSLAIGILLGKISRPKDPSLFQIDLSNCISEEIILG